MPTRVQYQLRPPFFISSRLTPAVKVGDATIHMHAASIDTEDSHDPRVTWEYTIEGPTVYHSGRDLTTPYLGPATVASQLPHAMGTLLGYLSHVADGDDDDSPLPDVVHEWSRLHRNELALTADLIENAPDRPMRSSAAWWALTHDPYQSPYGRWCTGQATAHADRLATLSPGNLAASGLVVRDEQWHQPPWPGTRCSPISRNQNPPPRWVSSATATPSSLGCADPPRTPPLLRWPNT